MKNYEPTFGIKDTAQNVRFFVEANMDAFWRIYKPLLPYILGCYLLDAVITDIYFSQSKSGFQLFELLSSYFLTALVISWHRVVIQGPDDYEPMNPFRPKRHEWAFIGVGILIAVGVFLIAFGTVWGAILTRDGFWGLLSFAAVLAAIYGAYRLSFYFPARAVNAGVTLKQAFRLSKGYLLRLVCASFMASIRLFLMTVGYVFVVMFVYGLFVEITGLSRLNGIVGFVLMLPVYIYFQPLMTVMGVTALSNYYLYAMQNEKRANDAISV